MRDQVEAYAVYVASVAGTVFAFVLAQLNALGGSNVLPAIVGIVAVLGSAERYRRDRAARLLMEKRLNEHRVEKAP